jgi:diguanylate cyclase (GGDEF)-like protein/PAS domain S-box-containing protein
MPKERVFLAEDEGVVAVEIAKSLESLGYILAGQADLGEIAIQKIEELRPDVVLMEIRLKGETNGVDAAKYIYNNLDIPVVFISAYADTLTPQTAMMAHAYGLMVRPFEEREIRFSISMAILKHSMTRQLRESEERYSLVALASSDGIWDWNLKTNEISYSTRWREMLGYDENGIGTKPEEWFKLVHPADRKVFQANLVSHLKGITSHFECEHRIRHSSGDYLWVVSRGLAARDAKGNAYRLAGSLSDITPRKFAEERLAHDAVHDPLTGLPNRVLFLDRLQNRLERTRRNANDSFAVMFLDIDRFKVVNDSLGHAYGDQLLITVANRLKQCLRPEDTVSRLSGDEFAVLLNDTQDVNDARSVAERIKVQLIATTLLGNVERSPTVSIGIAMFTKGYSKAEELLRDADSAMYYAKSLGGNQYQLFDRSMHANAVELIQLEGELKRAVARKEWLVHYQAIISLTTNEIVGAEALVRWLHPQKGIIPPLEFIHVAEDTGLILPIGEYVLRTACLQAKAWREGGRPNFWVSVNISGRQFQDQKLVEKINLILTETELPGSALRLEITESMAIRDIRYTIRILKELNELGVETSLDDFGTGYSSLNYLKQFPLKVLKIDKTFIQDIRQNKKNESLITAIITIARALSLEVVAEGVENDEQLAFLHAQFCNYVQGFLLGHPMPEEELTKLLQ